MDQQVCRHRSQNHSEIKDGDMGYNSTKGEPDGDNKCQHQHRPQAELWSPSGFWQGTVIFV
jgi:hypothetical protein